MNILFISAVFPYPLFSGGQVRIYNLLKRLSKDHTITLYSFIRRKEEQNLVKHVSFLKAVHLYDRGYVWQPKYVLRSLTSSLPLLLSSYENAQMKEDIANDLIHNSYDLVHIEPFYVMPSVPSDLPCPLVVSEHNIEYDVYQSYVSQFPIPLLRPLFSVDIKKIRLHEEAAWKKAKKIITVSNTDADTVRLIGKKEHVSVLPNAVDTQYIPFTKRFFNHKDLRFLFVGNFLWMPNTKAVEVLLLKIWPLVKSRFPQAKLRIIGKHLPEALQKKAFDTGVDYDAYVEEIRTEYKKATILIAPMTIAGGTKFKMLEAMASGCLVMTTKEGMEGIDAQDHIHYLQATNPESYGVLVEELIRKKNIFENIVTDARTLIEKKYTWDAIANMQSQVWKKAV